MCVCFRCAVDNKVNVVESGVSLRARLEMPLLLYQGVYGDFSVQCRVSLCDRRQQSCVPVSIYSCLKESMTKRKRMFQVNPESVLCVVINIVICVPVSLYASNCPCKT